MPAVTRPLRDYRKSAFRERPRPDEAANLERRFAAAQEVLCRLSQRLRWEVILLPNRRDDIEQEPFTAADSRLSYVHSPVRNAIGRDARRNRRIAPRAVTVGPSAGGYSALYLCMNPFDGRNGFHSSNRVHYCTQGPCPLANYRSRDISPDSTDLAQRTALAV